MQQHVLQHCNGLENVGASCEKHGLKIIIGIFIKDSIDNAREQKDCITKWAKFELVELAVIGNEAVFSNKTCAEELASFIKECKTEWSGKGYTGPITTSEPLNIWQESGFKSSIC